VLCLRARRHRRSRPVALTPTPPSPPSRSLLRAVAIAATLYALTTIAITWPVFRRPGTTVLDTRSLYGEAWTLVQRDVSLTMWILAWDTHALTTRPARLFHANAFHPAPYSLATSEHMLGNLPWFAPVFLLTGNPVLAHQVTLLVSFVLSGLAMAWLVVYWTDDRVAALASGFLFAFAPYRVWQLGNLHVISIQYLPLVLLGIDLALDRRAPRGGPVLLAAALILSTLCSYYVGYAAFALAGVYTASGLVTRGRPALAGVPGVAAGTAVAAALMGALTIPYLLLQRSGFLPDYTQQEASLAFLGILKFGALGMLSWFVLPGRHGIPQYLTVPTMVLAGYALLRWQRLPRGALLAAGVAGAILFLGPILPTPWMVLPLPYRWFMDTVPGFAAMRAPQRFGAVVTVAAVALAGLGLALARRRLAARPRAPALVALVAVLVMLGEVWPRHLGALSVSPQGSVPAAMEWLRTNGQGGAVLALPMDRWDLYRESRYVYDSIFHWSPIVNGYSSYPPKLYITLADEAAKLPQASVLDAILAMVDVRWVLFYLGEVPPDARAGWTAMLDARLPRAATFDDAIVYAVPPRSTSEAPGATGVPDGARPAYDVPRKGSSEGNNMTIGRGRFDAARHQCACRPGRVRRPSRLGSPGRSAPILVRTCPTHTSMRGTTRRTWPGCWRGRLTRSPPRRRACSTRTSITRPPGRSCTARWRSAASPTSLRPSCCRAIRRSRCFSRSSCSSPRLRRRGWRRRSGSCPSSSCNA
jgi:hypothetical protein